MRNQKETGLVLRKPTVAVVMVPRLGRLAPVARKMYNVLLYKAQMKMIELAAAGQVMEATSTFRAPLVEIVDAASKSDADIRTVAKAYLKAMRKIEVDWEAPDAASGVIWHSMGLLSQATLEVVDGITWVDWAFPPALLSALADPDRFTLLDLEYMAGLKSYAAIALYEICSRYKNNPTGVTSKNPVDWWIDALSNTPPTKDPETGEFRRREWRKFKNEFVMPAIEEVNTKTDLTIGLNEEKVGKAFAFAQFFIQKKRTVLPDAVLSDEVAAFAAKLDVSLPEMVKLVKSGRYGNGALMVALHKLDGRLSQPDLPPVENRAAYVRKLLEEDAKYLASSVGSPAQQQLELAPRGIAYTPTGDEGTHEATWLEKRYAGIKADLLALSEKEQSRYTEIAAEELSQKGLMPAQLRRLKTGDWKSGVLLSTVMEVFAREAYGPDWKVEPRRPD